MGIFNFGLEKSQKSRNPGDRDQDLKVRRNPGRKIRDFSNLGILIPGIRDFYPRGFRKIPGVYSKSLGFLSSGFGFFSGFFAFGIYRGFFIPWIRIFSWDGISQQKANSGYLPGGSLI